jgi:tryptophanyl-tRNA synthetase
MENSFRSGGRGYGDYKKMLADKLWQMLATFREKRQQLLAQPGLVKDILHAGAQKARAVARATINKVREVTGLGALHSC